MKSKLIHLNDIFLKEISTKKVLCLVDGQHYPPVIKGAINELLECGANIIGLFFLGGTEKVDNAFDELKGIGKNIEIIVPENTNNLPFKELDKALEIYKPEFLLDLSDEPVVDYESRFRIAAICLKNRVAYLGGDFYFTPPMEKEIIKNIPSLAIIGTGKRIGKTAIGVTISRILKKNKFNPIVICMGRGGPGEPEFIDIEKIKIHPDTLIDVAKKGKHAASDYWEDAILGGVATVGCRRCGGGMAGNPVYSNVLEGVKIANELSYEFMVVEGSGSTFPPVKTDLKITLLGANQPLWKLKDYFGQYRIMIADLIIVTMCEKTLASPEKIEEIENYIKEINPEVKVLLTKFRPEPHQDISGKKVYLGTTAKGEIGQIIKKYLEKTYRCEIVGFSNHLSNRKLLREDLQNGLKEADLLLTEIKAGSIDVAAIEASKLNKEVVFMHNKAVSINEINIEKEITSLCNSIKGK